jgi:hypothetical protein
MATVTSMSDYSKEDREAGMDLLEASEAWFVELGAPSRLAVAIFTVVMTT